MALGFVQKIIPQLIQILRPKISLEWLYWKIMLSNFWWSQNPWLSGSFAGLLLAAPGLNLEARFFF